MLSERALATIAVVTGTLVLACAASYRYQFERTRSLLIAARGPLTNVRYLAAPIDSAQTVIREDIYWPGGSDSARRFTTTYDELSKSFVLDAIRASEDKRFQTHAGIDFYATLPRLIHGSGASTIEMQLARTAILRTRSGGALRKVNEAFASMAIEELLTKDEIVTAYANSIYCGTSRNHLSLIGVKSAARYTFGKTISNLTLPEAAAIAGLFARPKQLLDAYAGNVSVIKRYRDRVLRRMGEEWPGRYSKEAILRAIDTPVVLGPESIDSGDDRALYGTYFDSARALTPELKHVPEQSDVVLSVDPAAQQAAGQALAETVALWQSAAGPERHLDGALVAMDPFTGDVIALVGGVDYTRSQLNRALQLYEPGSVVKPAIYADALARLTYSGAPFTAATRIDLSDGYVGDWAPKEHAAGSPTLRQALSWSSNRAAVSVGKQAGLRSIREVLKKIFDTSPNLEGPMLLGGAGGSEASPLAVAQGYASFVNGGRRPKARFLREIRGSSGASFKIAVHSDPVLDPGAASIVLQASRSVTGDIELAGATLVSGKTASGLPPSAQVGGKTGTGNSSNWTVIVHPHLVVAIVVACDDGCKLQMSEGFTGGNVAGAVWSAFVRRLYHQRRAYFDGAFPIPPELVRLNIDPNRGCSLADNAAQSEYFIRGRMPPACGGR